MKKSVLRAALLSSASFGLSAVSAVIMPSSAKAQTICSGIIGITSTSISCQDGTTVVASGSTENSTIVNPTAQGLSTTSAGAQTLTLTPGSATNNTIRVNVDSTAGIIASAGGALTVNAPDVNVSTLGFGSDAVNLAGSSVTAVLGDLRAVDQASNPLEVTSSGAIDVTVGTTFGSDLGVVINGGAGAINFTADSVDSYLGTGATVTGTGAITVDVGAASGGVGGLRINGGAGAIDLDVGTAAQDGSAGAAAISITGTGPITVEATGPITTNGQNAEGILIQGGAGTISVTTANVSTTGIGAAGISISGTGMVVGSIGDITTNANNSSGLLVTTTGNVDLTVGDVDYGGEFSDGVVINAGTSAIDVDIGTVTNHAGGASNDGVNLTGGAITATIDEIDISTQGGIALQVNASDDVDVTVGDVSNFSAGILINAAANNVDLACGNITTSNINTNSVEINATGTIDLLCGNINTAVGTSYDGSTSLDINGGAGAINATIGNVTQEGAVANAVEVSGTGLITLTTGNVTSDNYSSSAIEITGGAGAIDLTCGNILVQSQNNTGIRITGTGTIDVTCGNLTNQWATTSAGFDSMLAIAGGAGAINATVGNVTQTSGGSDAVLVTGTGPITLVTGNVTSTGPNYTEPARGVVVQGGAGPLDVTVASASTVADLSDAIALSGTGPITLRAPGPITTSGEDSLGVEILGGAGAIDATVGTVSTSGEFSTGVWINGTGPITLRTGAITTNDNEASGVIINGGAGAINVTTGTILAQGQDLFGVRVIGTGPITTTTGAITTTESSSTGLSISGGSGLVTANFSNIDTLDSGRPALRITSTGAIVLNGGSATLRTDANNSTTAQISGGSISGSIGNLIATGGNSVGLSATATGAINLTIGGATTTGNAIEATTTGGGAITLNITGNIASSSGIGIYTLTNAAGALTTVNVAAGRTVTGTVGAIAFDGVGSAVVNNSGTIGTAGGLAVWTQVGVPVTINNLAGATLNGRVDLSHGVDSIINAGTWNAAGINNFLTGTDIVSNLAGGVINIAAGVTFTGLETFTNAGTLNAANGILFDLNNTAFSNTGTFNLAGALDLGAGTDSFANSGSGILNLTGNASILGAETFTQSGRINLNTFTLTGPALAFINSGFVDTNGNAGIGGFTSFSNAGTLDLAPGTFTVPAALFTNSGTILADEGASTITGQTGFANSGTIDLQDGATGDVLTINSNFVGSGSSNLAIDVVGTATGNTADLLVVTGNISGTTVVNPTFLSPAIDPDGVLIVDGGGTLAANSFTLGNVTSQGLINYSLLTQGNDVFLATAANVAVFDIGLLGSMNQDMWYQSADAYLACAASRRNELGADRKSPVSICGQLYFGRDRYGDRNRSAVLFGDTLTYSDRVSTHRRGAQLDLGARAGSKLRFGLTAGYEHADARLATGSDLDLEGHNVGAYVQYGGERGVYAGLMVKRDRYDARFANPAISAVKIDAKSTGIDGELGWRLRGLGALIDLNAGLSHVRSKLDDFTAGNIAFDNDSATSLRGRLGARLAWSGDWAPFLAAAAFHEFKGDDDIVLTSGTASDGFGRRGRGTWARLEGGLGGGAGGGPLLSVWGDFGDVKGWGLRAGFRF